MIEPIYIAYSLYSLENSMRPSLSGAFRTKGWNPRCLLSLIWGGQQLDLLAPDTAWVWKGLWPWWLMRNPSIALESVLAQKQEDTARSSQHRTPVMRGRLGRSCGWRVALRGLVVDGLSFGCCVRTAAEPLRRSKVLSIFPRFFAKQGGPGGKAQPRSTELPD